MNYIWISKRQAVSGPDNPECTIPMGNISNAVTNANKYPGADFRIWVDKKYLDYYSLLCVEQFVKDNAQHHNIQVHDLQTIPDYANDPYFVPLTNKDKGYLGEGFNRTGPRNVYARADYARILVLDHCMQSCPERAHIIYSDMDCPDIGLKNLLPRVGAEPTPLAYELPENVLQEWKETRHLVDKTRRDVGIAKLAFAPAAGLYDAAQCQLDTFAGLERSYKLFGSVA